MLEISTFNEVTQITMGYEINGSVLYRVSAYLVDGLLIDTGCQHTASELSDYLSECNLKKVVNTHYHEDHIGGNKIIEERFGIKAMAYPLSISLMMSKPLLYPYQELVWGYPEITDVAQIPGTTISTGRYNFKVIEIPGHSPDHIALVEPEQGWCFTGDLFVSQSPKVIRPEENAGEIMQSMKKLIDLPYQITLFPAVGEVVLEGREALKSCVEYLTGMRQKCRELEQKGLTTPEIRDLIFGRESALFMLTDGQFSSENLIKSLLETE